MHLHGGEETEGIRKLATLLGALHEHANVVNEGGGFVNIDASLFVSMGCHGDGQ